MDAICITAYKSPEMLSDLLDSIQDDFLCYVHVDIRAKDQFLNVEKEHSIVKFFYVYEVNWGSLEHLQAILYLLKNSLNDEWRYLHLISGEDYPIVSNRELTERFSADDKSYANYENATDRHSHANRRYRYFWLYTRYRQNYKNSSTRLLNLGFVALQWLFVNRRKIGEINDVYWGFVWGDYHRDAVICILNYLDNHNDFLKDLEWCKIPEELVFQTILLNDPVQKNKLVNKTLRYWNIRSEDSGPAYLKESDFEKLKNSNSVFARKVQPGTEILEAIRKLRQESN